MILAGGESHKMPRAMILELTSWRATTDADGRWRASEAGVGHETNAIRRKWTIITTLEAATDEAGRKWACDAGATTGEAEATSRG